MTRRATAFAPIAMVVIIGGLSACSGTADAGLPGPSPVTPPGVSTPSPGGAGNALLRLRCEARSGRSKISVDGNNLTPGTYRASVRSGGNIAMSNARTAIGDEVEFDFDSDPNDIAGGASRIAPDFIQGGRVEGTLSNASGQVIASAVVTCSWQ